MPIDPDDFDKPGPAVTPRPVITPPPTVVAAKATPPPAPQPSAYQIPQSIPQVQPAPSGAGKVFAGIAAVVLVGIGIWFVANEGAKPASQVASVPTTPSTQSPGRIVEPTVRQAPQVRSVSSSETQLLEASNYEDDWLKVADQGSTQMFYSARDLRILVQPTNPPSGMTLRTKKAVSGDVDAMFEFNHQGYGRTNIGLWSAQRNDWASIVTLDTNDTDLLAFSAGGPSTEYKHRGGPYMNKWTTIRLQFSGTMINFFADGILMETMQLPRETYYLALNVGCASWKSGANDTRFRRVSILEPTPAPPVAIASIEPPAQRIKPSFNCEKARTPSEKLICRNNVAASAEQGMVAAYNELLNQLSGDAQTAFQKEHYEWFKEFARTCNALAATGTENDLANCVVGYLSNHTTQLRQRIAR